MSLSITSILNGGCFLIIFQKLFSYVNREINLKKGDKTMFIDLNLPEKLYWMNRNSGEQETGYLLTKEQLLNYLPPMYINGVNEDGTASFRARDYSHRVPNENDLERLVSNKDHSFTGSFGKDDIFTVTELTKRSQVKDYITWKNYSPETSLNTHRVTTPYPEYVCDKYRLEHYGDKLSCYTSKYLPDGKEKNPTIDKWRKKLGVERHQMHYKYSREMEAAIEIAASLEEGLLTPDIYKDIVLSSVLGKEDMDLLEEYKDISMQEKKTDDLSSINIRIDIPAEYIDSQYASDLLNEADFFTSSINSSYPGVTTAIECEGMENDKDYE